MEWGCIPLGWSGSGPEMKITQAIWCIRGDDECTLGKYSMVHNDHYDPRDWSWSTIQAKALNLSNGRKEN